MLHSQLLLLLLEKIKKVSLFLLLFAALQGNKRRNNKFNVNAGMTFKCPLLETLIIQCSKDDVEIGKTVAAMVALGISLEKIQVIFYEDIERAEMRGVSLEELKKQDALEKMQKENQEKVKGSNARSDNKDDGDEMEDEDYCSDEEMDDEDSEMDDEDSEMDGEDDDDDDDM